MSASNGDATKPTACLLTAVSSGASQETLPQRTRNASRSLFAGSKLIAFCSAPNPRDAGAAAALRAAAAMPAQAPEPSFRSQLRCSVQRGIRGFTTRTKMEVLFIN